MSRYKPYPEYKDSGVEWIGEVPAHWSTQKSKFLFVEVSEKSRSGQEELLSVSEHTGVQRRSDGLSDGDLLTRAETLEGYKLCSKGDIVINIMLAWKRGLGVSFLDGLVSPAYAVFRSRGGISMSYMAYLLRDDIYTSEYRRRSTGIIDSRLRLYPDDFGGIEVLLPTQTEQSQIAKFLDRETTRIDTLIEKKQRFIELLEEKRQAVITQAVTKGLDPNVPMKDSGVEWIGEVPAHWEVVSLRHHATYQNSNVDKKSNEGEEPVRLCNYTDVYYNEFINSDGSYMEATASREEIARFRLRVNDVVITKDSEDPEDIAVPALITHSQDDFVCGYHLTIIRSGDDAAQRFLHRLFDSLAARSYFFQECPGVTRFGLNQNAIGAFTYGLPPKEEMRQITIFLDRETTRIDTLTEKTRESIELLKERRSALITAAVTGKIDVREEAA